LLTIRVAAIAPSTTSDDVEANLIRFEDLVRDAARHHAPDLIVLPESFAAPRLPGAGRLDVIRPIDGASLTLLRRLAAELDCVLAGGALVVRGRHAYSTFMLVEPDGRTHLHDRGVLSRTERIDLRPGDDDGRSVVVRWNRSPVALVSGAEWRSPRTVARLRGTDPGLILGGDIGGRGSAASALSRAVGAPSVLATHTAGAVICAADGRVLANLDPGDGAGHISATIDLAHRPAGIVRAEPREDPGHDLGPRLARAAGAATYRIRHVRKRFRWQDAPGTDLPDETGPTPTGGDGGRRVAPEREVLVADRRHIADGVAGLTFVAPNGGLLPLWVPGAHIDLVLPTGEVRQYSLCGDPASGRYDIGVLDVVGGRGGSRWIHEHLHAGDRIRIRGPRNHFAFDPTRAPLFVAGGIGITPIRSMVARAHALGLDWQLVYGGRNLGAMAFVDELRELDPSRVHLVPQDSAGVVDLEAVVAKAPADGVVYACGPGPMLTALETLMGESSSAPLRVERFTAVPREPTIDVAFAIDLVRSGRRLEVPAHRRALDVLLEAGVVVDNACRSGVCGSCALRVLDGRPDHRDSLPADARGETMMVCVSRALTATVTLDA
jgi:ferredoxin-NADP reductase/predicted amidohydrolase